MIVKENTTGTKRVNITQNDTQIIAMYVQIYKGEQQVLASKSFSTIKRAEKWAEKKLTL